jgi:hypothetical protein
MEIRKVLVHSCFQKKKKVLSPTKCRCRQYLSVMEAASLVNQGLAQYVIASEKIVESDEVCNVCAGIDNLKKTCTVCGGTGSVKHSKVFVIRGEDIIYISLDGKKNAKTTKVKKSPTIEKAHIERAYVDGNITDQSRIESYGVSNKEFLISLISGFEPEDDASKGTGRRYDYGRKL